MPPKYTLEQKVDAVIATLNPMLEALEIQNDLRAEFVASLLKRLDKLEATSSAELATQYGALLAIVAELQRLKLVKPGDMPAAQDDDVLIVRIPSIRLTRAAVVKAFGWLWTKIRAPLAAVLLAWLAWLAAKAGIQWRP